MEHLWSPAGAIGGNRSQIGAPRKRLKQAHPQQVATHGNRFTAHGKEGVDGSSPSEGSAKAPLDGAFCMCSVGARAVEGLDGAVYGASRREGAGSPAHVGGQGPSGLPISHSWPNGSMIRPSRQPCSSPTAEVSFAPARTACAATVSGSSTTSSVRLVVPCRPVGTASRPI
jgi:hypothetical protein